MIDWMLEPKGAQWGKRTRRPLLRAAGLRGERKALMAAGPFVPEAETQSK